MFSDVRKRAKKAGLAPGSARYTGDIKKTPDITVITYDKENCHETIVKDIDDWSPDKNESGNTWINVEGLDDTDAIKKLAKYFNLHPLTIEDILNVEQRAKVEEFEGYIYVTMKVLMWQKSHTTFTTKQISLILGENFVLSFQELDTTLFDKIRSHLCGSSTQRLRQQGSDYLAYRLIDAVVDEYFVVLEALGDQIEAAEERIIAEPTPLNMRTIYRLKRQMILLRKSIWPLREAVSHLLNEDAELITRYTHLYLRDVYDHIVQAIDTVETFRDMLGGMLDMYLSSLTNRMNEIVKTLTIITTIFIPISTIAGIYGMNIPNIPGIRSPWAFMMVLVMMLFVAISMLLYFRKKKWI